jgi:hypothetical protein
MTAVPSIGYVPVSRDLRHPTDERLFVPYARARGIPFEVIDQPGDHDLVILTARADLTRWRQASAKTKILFVLEDSYLADSPHDPKAIFRGLAKFAARQHAHLEFNYQQTLIEMCRRAAAVLCSTPEQARTIASYAKNVYAIPGFQGDLVRAVKSDWRRGEVLNLVWEGLGANVQTFEVIRDVLAALASKQRLALHLITDVEHARALGNLGRRSTLKLARRTIPIRDINVYQWNQTTFAHIATQCDLAVIPLPLERPMWAGKPANKLFLLWRLGIPTLTSASAAYIAAMEGAGLSGACHSNEEWLAKLDEMQSSATLRELNAVRGRAYAESVAGTDALMGRWDAMLQDVVPGDDLPWSSRRSRYAAATARC